VKKIDSLDLERHKYWKVLHASLAYKSSIMGYIIISALAPKYQIIELPIDAGACRENFHVNQ
jgi:hypothetical protein